MKFSNNISRTSHAFSLITFVVISELAGIIGSVFTMSAIPSWYATLVKPALNPPGWVFGPVWTLLYLLMGVAAWLVWKQGWKKFEVKVALGFFAGQLVLNAAWSIIFFGGHNPTVSLLEILALWLAILGTIIAFGRVSKPAAWLLVPYLLWVSFATYLNFAIWMLN